MRKKDYIRMLDEHVKEFSAKLQLGHNRTYQKGNNRKLASKVVKKWFKDSDVDVL